MSSQDQETQASPGNEALALERIVFFSDAVMADRQDQQRRHRPVL